MIFPKSDQVLDQKDPALNILSLIELRSVNEAKRLVSHELFSDEPLYEEYLNSMLVELLKAQRIKQFLCAYPNEDIRKNILRLLQEGESRTEWLDLSRLWSEYSKARENPETFANSDEIRAELSALDNPYN